MCLSTVEGNVQSGGLESQILPTIDEGNVMKCERIEPGLEVLCYKIAMRYIS
jgi:hypothetical protein